MCLALGLALVAVGMGPSKLGLAAEPQRPAAEVVLPRLRLVGCSRQLRGRRKLRLDKVARVVAYGPRCCPLELAGGRPGDAAGAEEATAAASLEACWSRLPPLAGVRLQARGRRVSVSGGRSLRWSVDGCS